MHNVSPRGFGAACSDPGRFNSKDSDPPGDACRRSCRGAATRLCTMPPRSAHGRIRLQVVEASQASEKQRQPRAGGRIPPRNVAPEVQGEEARVQGEANVSFH